MNSAIKSAMAVVVIGVVAASVSDCGGESSRAVQSPSATEQALSSLDAFLQYTTRWIENPKLDLMTPEGTFLRAAVESMDRARFAPGTGMDAIEAGGFPGIVQAFNNSADPTIVAGNGNKGEISVGTDYWEVVEFHRDGDLFTAGVCDYGSMTAIKKSKGFESWGRNLPNGHAVTLTFGPDANLSPQMQRAPKANQRGGLRAPIVNVFGTWKMTHYDNYNADMKLPQCGTTLAPGTPPDAPDHRYYPETPPPTLPPSPGWPSGGGS
jgi:hypothetical protein